MIHWISQESHLSEGDQENLARPEFQQSFNQHCLTRPFDYGIRDAVAGLGHLTPRCVTAYGYSSQHRAFAGPLQSGCGLESSILPVDALA